MYGPKGWTTRLIEALTQKGAIIRSTRVEYIPVHYLKAEDLLAILEIIPPENLEDNQNGGPTLRCMEEIAKACPEAVFGGYIIDGSRDDERLSLDGFIVPEVFSIDTFLEKYRTPDEDDVEGGKRRLWWD